MAALSGARGASIGRAAPPATGAAQLCRSLSFSSSSCCAELLRRHHASDDLPIASRQSLIGEHMATVVHRMLSTASSGGGGATAAAGARAEFCVAWPPTFPVGGAAEVVELRAAVSLDAATATEAYGEAGGDAERSGRSTTVAAAAAECCSRVLAVREGFVVGDEGIKMGPEDGVRARARIRLHSTHPGVTTCILAGQQGVPSLESFEGAAPLMGLPQAAREEAHKLLWRMMHEALPPNHSVLPYDPDAFRSPIDLQPPKLQAALSWAWSHHFRAFALDFSYLLEPPPPPGGEGGTMYGTHAATSGATSGVAQAPLYDDDEDAASHYQSVLAQMVCFLRDNDMFACLATLLQTAVGRGGLALVGGGDGAASPPPPPPLLSTSYPRLPSADGGGAAAATVSSALAALRAAAAARSTDANGAAAAADDDNDADADVLLTPLSPGGTDEWSVSSACSSPRPSYNAAAAFAAGSTAADAAFAAFVDGYDGSYGYYFDGCDDTLMMTCEVLIPHLPSSYSPIEETARADRAGTDHYYGREDCGEGEVVSEGQVAAAAAAIEASSAPVVTLPRLALAATTAVVMVVMLLLSLTHEVLGSGLELLCATAGAQAAAAAQVSSGLYVIVPGGHQMWSAVIVMAVTATAAAVTALLGRAGGTALRPGNSGVREAASNLPEVLLRLAGAVLLAVVTWWAAAVASAAALTPAAAPGGLAAAAAAVAAAALLAAVSVRWQHWSRGL